MSSEGESEELPDLSEEQVGEEIDAGGDAGARIARELGLVMDVPLRLSVQVGGAKLLVRDVLQLNKGSVVELDRLNGEPADVLVNDRLVARGDVTVVEDRLAVRIIEVLTHDEGQATGH